MKFCLQFWQLRDSSLIAIQKTTTRGFFFPDPLHPKPFLYLSLHHLNHPLFVGAVDSPDIHRSDERHRIGMVGSNHIFNILEFGLAGLNQQFIFVLAPNCPFPPVTGADRPHIHASRQMLFHQERTDFFGFLLVPTSGVDKNHIFYIVILGDLCISLQATNFYQYTNISIFVLIRN